MVHYKFYINEEGGLCCCRVFNGEETKISRKDSSKLLKKFDENPFHSMTVRQKDMVFKTNYGEVYFINYKRILHTFGGTLLIETLPRIEQFLQDKKNTKQTVRNLRIVNKKFLIGTFALLLVSMSSDSVTKENSDFPINKGVSNVIKIIPMSPLTLQPAPEIEKISTATEKINVAHLDYHDLSDSKTAENAYDAYYSVVDTCAKRWGISSRLVMAILTQESAGIDRNLMQIQLHSWEDQILKPYNYEENCYQRYVLTSHPEKYEGEDIVCISASDLEDPAINISTGCILLMESFKNMRYHIGAGIQCYNLGVGNMARVLEQTSIETGTLVQDILSDQKNLDFMEYTEIVQCGDPAYLNHVLRYMDNAEDGIDIKYIDEKGNIEQKNITILSKKKQY